MSKSSGKLNIINQNTYEDLQNDNKESAQMMLRSAKNKNMHKKEQQCSLLDFVILSRKQQKQQKRVNRKRRPHLIIARNSFIYQPKRKGKTRQNLKIHISRLKRIIRNFRRTKQQMSDYHNDVNHLEATFRGMLIEQSNKQKLNVKVEDNLSNQLDMQQNVIEPKEKLICKSMQATHQIHSRRFRSYCDNCTTKLLKELTTRLLNDLERFQKRAYAINEIKARAHPRLVVGFRESLARMRINKVKLLLLAIDCESCPTKGGLDDIIDELKSVCQLQLVPYCFSLMRRELAYALHKRAQISCVAILDLDGVNDTFQQLLHELHEARQFYKELTAA
ncbi:hypothetical protein KR093_010704 [Drosophila rubida]|uniref:Ribosomal protein eL8/eL30/eS12/Gadd45 domain-containing protein n=1 Tax=Drosophila rubida TaxID=30044 RepID=A0AAD4K2Y6_9MUSC|nr:hypothetical protein KR093_010704 [Drosophila rubida]